jgi:orotate phosphoribosyltransferase
MTTLAARIRQCARLRGQFALRSGKVSDTYFDKYQLESDPLLLLAIAQAMAPLLPTGTQVLAGLEMGGIPIVTMLSQVTGLPAAFIRKQPKEYGTCRYAEGVSLVGKRFILVEDVVSSGGAILDALRLLQTDGLRPTGALCVIDRQSGGAETLAKAGLLLRALLTFSEVECA